MRLDPRALQVRSVSRYRYVPAIRDACEATEDFAHRFPPVRSAAVLTFACRSMPGPACGVALTDPSFAPISIGVRAPLGAHLPSRQRHGALFENRYPRFVAAMAEFRLIGRLQEYPRYDARGFPHYALPVDDREERGGGDRPLHRIGARAHQSLDHRRHWLNRRHAGRRARAIEAPAGGTPRTSLARFRTTARRRSSSRVPAPTTR